MRGFFLIALALACSAAVGETYRWIDASGRIIFSDTPPPGQARAVEKIESASQGDGLSFATKRATENFPVVLYTAPSCTDNCKHARELLNARGVPFAEKSLLQQADFDELKALVGDAFVPSLKVGKQSFRGFDAGAYNNLLDLAGYPKSAPYGSKSSGGANP